MGCSILCWCSVVLLADFQQPSTVSSCTPKVRVWNKRDILGEFWLRKRSSIVNQHNIYIFQIRILKNFPYIWKNIFFPFICADDDGKFNSVFWCFGIQVLTAKKDAPICQWSNNRKYSVIVMGARWVGKGDVENLRGLERSVKKSFFMEFSFFAIAGICKKIDTKISLQEKFQGDFVDWWAWPPSFADEKGIIESIKGTVFIIIKYQSVWGWWIEEALRFCMQI